MDKEKENNLVMVIRLMIDTILSFVAFKYSIAYFISTKDFSFSADNFIRYILLVVWIRLVIPCKNK